VTDRARLCEILDGVRRSRCAIVDQELELGLRSIAVPVTDAGGRVLAALNAGTPSVRVSLRELQQRFLRNCVRPRPSWARSSGVRADQARCSLVALLVACSSSSNGTMQLRSGSHSFSRKHASMSRKPSDVTPCGSRSSGIAAIASGKR